MGGEKPGSPLRMPREIRVLLLAIGVIFVLVVLAFIFSIPARPPVGPRLPNPNGYDDFLKAEALLAGDVAPGPHFDQC
jgi:hypothetical protein